MVCGDDVWFVFLYWGVGGGFLDMGSGGFGSGVVCGFWVGMYCCGVGVGVIVKKKFVEVRVRRKIYGCF